MTELIVAGEAFNVLVEGEEGAPVLMLSNSLGTSLRMWDKQIKDFTKHFRVVRYDARGHGHSVVTEEPYSIAQLGRDAIGIMDALGIEKANWLGLSMGGMVGQWLLINAPERIDRAVLANTAAQMGGPDFWNERIEIVREKSVGALAPSVVERWFTKSFIETQPDETAPILAGLEATSAAGYAASCAAIRDMDQRGDLHFIGNPTLVIVGRHDPATPPEMGALIASSIPGAKLVTLEAAHLSNIEDPEAFNQAVLEFLTAKAELQTEPAPSEEPSTEEPSAAGHSDEMEPAEAAVPEKPKKPRRKPAARKASAPTEEPAEAASTEPEPAIGIEAPLPEPEPEPEPVVAEKPTRRLASAPAARRRPVKKAAVKRSATRKAVGRVSSAKKAPVKKAAAKKTAVKKTPAKKTLSKKTSARKTVAKKPATRAAARKTAAGRAAAKKAPARKAAARKSAVRKAVTKKTVVKRGVAKKIAAKKLAPKKIAAKRVTAKKVIKKTSAKKTVAKKSSRKTVARRAPTRRTPSRKPGRKR
jgi:3-oxoadipate enol-lactonase